MLGLIVSGLFWFRTSHEAFSALWGGLVAILPELVFAVILFRHRGARAARKIVNSFYLGEGVKIVFSVGLFALVFGCFQVEPVVFFISYAWLVVSGGFLLLIFSKNKG